MDMDMKFFRKLPVPKELKEMCIRDSAYSDQDLKKVDELMDNARINGVEKVERLDFEQLHNREPHISDKALGALLANTTVMVDPFEVAIAFMENAMQNGVEPVSYTHLMKETTIK